jgi:hypothetical protein
MEWLFDLEGRPAQPRVRGMDQVPQRLRERPLAAHRNVDRAFSSSSGRGADGSQPGRPTGAAGRELSSALPGTAAHGRTLHIAAFTVSGSVSVPSQLSPFANGRRRARLSEGKAYSER